MRQVEGPLVGLDGDAFVLQALEECLVQLIVGGGRRGQRRGCTDRNSDRRQQVRFSHLSPQ
jgi:hypothetical protein